jgi:hypothetical protein
MRPRPWLCLAALLSPLSVLAGQVYGSITLDGKAVARAAIQINCAGAVSSGSTADDGSYRIDVPQEGQCTLSMPDYPGASAAIFSVPDPNQYDFEIVRQPNGNHELRRR